MGNRIGAKFGSWLSGRSRCGDIENCEPGPRCSRAVGGRRKELLKALLEEQLSKPKSGHTVQYPYHQEGGYRPHSSLKHARRGPWRTAPAQRRGSLHCTRRLSSLAKLVARTPGYGRRPFSDTMPLHPDGIYSRSISDRCPPTARQFVRSASLVPFPGTGYHSQTAPPRYQLLVRSNKLSSLPWVTPNQVGVVALLTPNGIGLGCTP